MADVFDVLQYKSVIVLLAVFTQPCSITNDLIQEHDTTLTKPYHFSF